jgi:hypothetical protein
MGPSDLGDKEHLRISPVGPSGTQGRESAAGLALSLHGIALCLLFLVGIYDTQGSQGGLEIVPVEVEIAPQSASAQAEPLTSALPQPDAAHPLDATAHGVAGSSEPDTDTLKANRGSGEAAPARHDDTERGERRRKT